MKGNLDLGGSAQAGVCWGGVRGELTLIMGLSTGLGGGRGEKGEGRQARMPLPDVNLSVLACRHGTDCIRAVCVCATQFPACVDLAGMQKMLQPLGQPLCMTRHALKHP